jgi:hypothetical protein
MWPLTQMMKTRTRTGGRETSRRARRPQLESLENRTVLSITFAAFNGDGTYAYHSAYGPSSGWSEITSWIPSIMAEGADGTLFATFPYGGGTWRYDYGSNQWTELTNQTAVALSAATDNTFFGSFTSGTYEYNGSWYRLTTDIASQLAAVSNHNVYLSLGSGTWQADHGSWTQLTSAIPIAMAASPDGTLFASYDGYGTFEWTADGGWVQRAMNAATQLDAVSNQMFYAELNNGLYEYISMTTGGPRLGSLPLRWATTARR